MIRYKDDIPTNTVTRIKTILSSLGIETDVIFFKSLDFFYSCRVYITNGCLSALSLGCNGKGMTKELALASGYSELLERIQNGQLFDLNIIRNFTHNHIGLESIFKEVYQITIKEIESILPNYITNQLIKAGIKSLNAISYQNIVDNSCYLLPEEILYKVCGTTGMCAGNTREEALVQGICEIIERKSLQKIYLDDIIYNTINPLFFSNEIIEILDILTNRYGIRYEIKDCTFIHGIPVIGLLLIDEINKRYSFRLGCDIDPNIALERCITEIFQGLSGTKNVFNNICFHKNIDVSREFFASFTNGQGLFKENVFCSNEYVENIYYKKIDTNVERLEYLIAILQNNGFAIYIRNNSYLSYPSYRIYIPYLSEYDNTLLDCQIFKERVSDRIFKINTLSKQELICLAQEIERKSITLINIFSLHRNAPKVEKSLLLFIIYERIGLRNKSIENLNYYLDSLKRKKQFYDNRLDSLLDYLSLNNRGVSDMQIEEILQKCHGYSLSQIKYYMKSILDLGDKFKCPNCVSCELTKGCLFNSYVEVFKLLYN